MRTRVARPAAACGLAVAVVAGFVAVGGATGASTASTVLATFTTPGGYDWTVPSGVRKVTFDVYGASGGNVASGQILLVEGGAGGEAKGQFAVKPGRMFEIVVGQRGSDNQGFRGGGGGFNGGGSAADAGSGFTLGGGGGGGGSDVRADGAWYRCVGSLMCPFGNRIIAAGGGGGGGVQAGFDGGSGGGLAGAASPSPGGGGGTQSDGGSCYPPCTGEGVFGAGGWGTQAPLDGSGPGAGGGGGGWYGGGGGTYSAQGGGGGGGSGFVSPLAKSGSYPGGTRRGDGEVIISTP